MPTQSVTVFLNNSSANTDNFTIRDCFGNVLATGITRAQLISGYNIVIDTLCGTFSLVSNSVECPNVTQNVLIPYRWMFNQSGNTFSTSEEACFAAQGGPNFWENSTVMSVGLTLSANSSLTTRYTPVSTGWYSVALIRTGSTEWPFYAIRVDSNSQVIEVVNCIGVSTTTTTTTAAPPPPPSPGSDVNLKTNIKLIGKSESGINIYSFNYINDLETTYQGVMAQELVGTEFENALGIDERGFYYVDYTKIDVEFKKI